MRRNSNFARYKTGGGGGEEEGGGEGVFGSSSTKLNSLQLSFGPHV